MTPHTRQPRSGSGDGPSLLSETQYSSAVFRLVDHYVERTASLEHLYEGGGNGQVEAVRALQFDIPQIDHLIFRPASPPPEIVVARNSLLLRSVHLLEVTQTPTERARWLELGVEAARELRRPLDESQHLGTLANASLRRNRDREAQEQFQAAFELAVMCDATSAQARWAGNLGAVAIRRMDNVNALAWLERARTLVQDRGDDRIEWTILSNLGSVYIALGQPKSALQCYQEALILARRLGDFRAQAQVLGQWARMHKDAGDYEKAIAAAADEYCLASEIGDLNGMVDGLACLARVFWRSGNASRAVAHFREALEMADTSDFLRYPRALIRHDLSLLLVQLGRHDEALPLALEARDLYVDIQRPAVEVEKLDAILQTITSQSP